MTTEKDPRSLFAPQPSAQQKALWDSFVEEYIKDYSPVRAAMRVGFNETFAQEYSKLFMAEPYVQRLITEHELKPAPTEEELNDRYRQQIEQTYLKVMGCGDPKAMVAAAAGLAKIRGYDQPKDTSADELGKLVDAFKEIAKVTPD